VDQAMKRALSLRAASECENARYPACKCRCGGALHGRGRTLDPRTLPLDDPHSPSTECKKCRGTGKLTDWDFATATPIEISCWKCKGAGRVFTRKIEKAVLP